MDQSVERNIGWSCELGLWSYAPCRGWYRWNLLKACVKG